MLLKTEEEVMQAISDLEKNDFIIANNAGCFEELFIQKLKREVNGVEVNFIGVRNIKIKEEYRGNGIFTKMIDIIEKQNINFIVDDIINSDLVVFLKKRGYEELIYQKYGYKKYLSMYKIKPA